MDNAKIDAWMKEISEQLKQLEQTLLAIREEQYARAMRIGLQRPYLDFRQPRLDGDRFQRAASPGSPNSKGESYAAQTGPGREQRGPEGPQEKP